MRSESHPHFLFFNPLDEIETMSGPIQCPPSYRMMESRFEQQYRLENEHLFTTSELSDLPHYCDNFCRPRRKQTPSLVSSKPLPPLPILDVSENGGKKRKNKEILKPFRELKKRFRQNETTVSIHCMIDWPVLF